MRYHFEAVSNRVRGLSAVIIFCLVFGVVLHHSAHSSDSVLTQKSQASSENEISTRFFQSLSEEEQNWLRNHPVISVVQDPDWPPVEFVDENGNPSGISNDYLNLVKLRLDVKFENVLGLDWQEAYARLKRWDIDVTTSVAETPERHKFWVFTKPYMNIPIVILTRSDVTYVGNISELNGKKVAVVDGYVANEWIERDFPSIELIKVKNVIEGIKRLQRGEVFALIDNMLVLSYYQAKLKLDDVKIAGWTPYVNAQAMAVRKDWPELAGIMQKAIDSIPESEIAAIYKKWVPLTYEHGFDHSVLLKAIAVFGAVVAGLLFWNYRLSSEIAGRKSMELALKQSEKRYRELWSKAPVMMLSLDTEARITLVTDLLCEELGYRRDELIGRKPFEFQTERSAIYAQSVVFPQFIQDGGLKDAALQLVKKDGEVMDVLLSVTAERDDEGNVLSSRSVFIDVTKRNRAEEALRETQRMYEDLVSGIPSGAYRFRMKAEGDWKFDFVSDRWCELNSLVREEVLQDPEVAFAHFHPEDRESFIELNKQVMSSLKPFSWEGRLIVENEIHWARIESRPRLLEDGDIVWNGVHTDITAAKIAEKTFRENEELLRGFFENAASLVWVKDLDGRFLKINRITERTIGLPANQIIGHTVTDLFSGAVAAVYSDNDRVALDLDQPVNFEEELSSPDGRNTFLSVKFPLKDSSGKTFGLGAICTDITDRKRSEMALQRLESAINQAAEVVVITDIKGDIVYVNPAFEDVTGYSRSEAMGKNTRILKSGKHKKEFYEKLWHTIKNGQVWKDRFINKTRNGRIYYEDATVSPVFGPSGEIVNFVAVKRDVTQHLELSRQLQQAQKMEAVGTLAGGVAHDFNNILQVTLGYTELMLNDRNLLENHRSDLSKIRDSAVRGADLVQRLMTFSRKTETNLRPLDLNNSVTEIRKMLERTIPKMIKIELNLAEDLKTVNADPTQIDQILMNLSVNARDAMPDGGILKFETANIQVDERLFQGVSGLQPGWHVMLSVSDTGSGIDTDHIEHIFEPFFTTKDVNQGTGLGLAIVHSVVQNHGGHVTCESRLGIGTTFKIFLPSFVCYEVGENSPRAFDQLGGSETILVVDDDPMIRDLSLRILTRVGYKVLEASNGFEAINIYQGSPNSIDLVLLDLIMPQMGGKSCLDKLLEIKKDVKVIIATGYSSESEASLISPDLVKGFVNKPFEMNELMRVVRKALDA